MSDLVERLHWWGAKWRATRNMPTLPADCREAAAEILRLQEENARLSEKAIIGEYMHTPEEFAEAIAKARREALEEAVKAVQGTAMPSRDDFVMRGPTAILMRAVASILSLSVEEEKR